MISKKSDTLTSEFLRVYTKRFDPGIIFILDLKNLGLRNIEALTECNMLAELDISNNMIKDITCFSKLIELFALNLSFNMVSSLASLSNCHKLSVLDLKANQISTTDELKHLAKLPNLRSLWLTDFANESANPVCGGPGYRTKAIAALKGVGRLDGVVVELDPPLYEPRRSAEVELPTDLNGLEWYGEMLPLYELFEKQKLRETKIELAQNKIKDLQEKCRSSDKEIEGRLRKIENIFKN